MTPEVKQNELEAYTNVVLNKMDIGIYAKLCGVTERQIYRRIEAFNKKSKFSKMKKE